MNFSSTDKTSEAIFFFGEREIRQEMLFAEFEAVLDGVVGIREFAARRMRACYCTISSQLQVKALVFFYIQFDADGGVTSEWNVPVRQLADRAAAGPDLGSGPIRLACRSQCPIAWHQEGLCDPQMRPGANELVMLRDALRVNRLGIVEAQSAPQAMDNQDMASLKKFIRNGAVSGVEQDQLGALLQAAQGMAGSSAIASEAIAQPIASISEGEKKVLVQEIKQRLQSNHRNKIARLIKEQRLHLKTVQNESVEELATVRQGFQQKIVDYERKLNLAEGKYQQEIVRNEQMEGQLRDQMAEQAKQFEKMRSQFDSQMQKWGMLKEENSESLKLQYESELRVKLQQASVALKQDVSQLNEEVTIRDKRLENMHQEVGVLKEEKQSLLEESGKRYLERLEQQGMTFVVFHPGAGHLALTMSQVGVYMDNPTAFVAERCKVSQEHYSIWLEHYQQPNCTHSFDDKACQQALSRTERPSQFEVGKSDRCELHKQLVR